MNVVIEACLSELDEMEAAFLRDCYLHEPKIPLPTFAKQWQLSQKAFRQLRGRAVSRLKESLAARNIHSLGDLV